MRSMPFRGGRCLPLSCGTMAMLAWSAAMVEPAAAHHVMGGTTPQTLWQGLLSGLAHPIIGLDHFSFIAAIGVVAAFLSGGMMIPLGFVIASALGVLAHVAKFDVPLAEVAVATSVLAAGLTLVLRPQLGPFGWTALAVVAGLFHGYAFGETVVGSERGTISAYVLGLAVVSLVMATIVKLAAHALLEPDGRVRLRGAGAVLSCLGAVFLTLALRAG